MPIIGSDILQAPVGTLQHRICECPMLATYRADYGPSAITMPQEAGVQVHGTVLAAHSTGLFPIPRLALDDSERPPPHGTFHWTKMADDSGFAKGVFYTDGSRIASSHPDTLRLGWSFVVLDHLNHTIAAACGVPPYYVVDIPGAEAWALLQALSVAMLGSTFRSDCKPCIDAIHAGQLWACAASRPLARIFQQLFPLMDDILPSAFVWMPAHTWPKDVGLKMLGNGQLLTFADRRGNDEADSAAKRAAASFAVNPVIVGQLDNYATQVYQAMLWLGRATHMATHFGPSSLRDSTASRAQANRVRSATKSGQPASSHSKPTAGRHSTEATALQAAAKRWSLRATIAAQQQAADEG